jgi:hypothetical protein
MSNMPVFERYPFNVDPLPEEEGGGFAITFPDLPVHLPRFTSETDWPLVHPLQTYS